MSWKEAAEPVLSRMPVVERPAGHVPFRRKLTWTAGILIVYFFLTNINPFGLAVGQGSDFFGQFRSVLAGSSGSLLQVGIGPIVTASIVLQLLGGANLLGLDTENDPRDQVLYQGLQKLLVIIISALTAAPMVFTGSFLPADEAVGSALGIGTFGVQLLIFAQIFVGGILILFMDEIVSKWGVGSGVGLFIIASVSQQIVGGFFSFSALGASGFFASWYGVIVGDVPASLSPFTAEGLQNLLFDPGNILALFTTVFIFGIVVYAESVRVEIPLSHARVKGARGRFPVKLIYASVLPMILVRALQANIQFLGQILSSQWAGMPAFLGEYSDAGQPISGLCDGEPARYHRAGLRDRAAAGGLHHVQAVRGDRRRAADGDASDDAPDVRKRVAPTPRHRFSRPQSGASPSTCGSPRLLPRAAKRALWQTRSSCRSNSPTPSRCRRC